MGFLDTHKGCIIGSVWEMETPGDGLLRAYKKGPEKNFATFYSLYQTQETVSHHNSKIW